jgi:glutamate/tyrosine decarboxylase-like PLP-dependent enzyme
LKRESLPDPVPALFPDAAQRVQVAHWLIEALQAALARVQAGPVTPTIDLQQFCAELEAFDFKSPRPLEETLRWAIERMEHGIVQMANPRYFGLFNPGANFPAQCADQIVASFNPQLASSASSPVPVALENHLIRVIAGRAGLGADATGHFATGGSEANYTALLCALTAAPADRAAGIVPVMAVATAGTTGGGMIDPLLACADIAQREGLWFHVDAAWGGAALASERLRGLLAGIERADSLIIDAHKWLATTMGCAIFITRKGHLLSEAFHASTSFMPSSLSNLDPYLNSVQWSRRFLGLRLFIALAAAGWEGLGAHVERAVEVVHQIKARLVERGWAIANDSGLAVLDAIPPPALGDVRALVRRVVASGRAWVAPTLFEGRDVVRICATNGETSASDIDALIAVLNEPG